MLRPLLLDLYTEQVAGFYDPDSATLFGVEGADRVVAFFEIVGQRLMVKAQEFGLGRRRALS